MMRSLRLGTLLCCAVLLGLVSPGVTSTLHADMTNPNFELFYHAAELANQAYEGESEIIGHYKGKSAWVSTPGDTNVQYVLIHNHKRNVQVIAVRGTVDETNWHLNMDTRTIKDDKTGIMMHHGFTVAARTIYKDIKPRLKRGYETYLTGHSLGGAVAGILGIYLTKDMYSVGGIITFGQPKFTNAAGVRAYENLPLLRIVYQNDVISLLPNKSKKGRTFAHIGATINLLDGPHYVYGNRNQTLRISQGALGRFFTQVSVPDHHMKRYIANLKEKVSGAKRVSFKDRNKYVVRRMKGDENRGGQWERKFNYSPHR